MRRAAGLRTSLSIVFLGLATSACGDEGSAGGTGMATIDADLGNPSIDAAGQDTPDAGRMFEDQVRFIAMGDTGTGSAKQYAVGTAVATLCADKGCDLIMLLGDNFYDSGVESVNDPLWQEYFELPYAGVPDGIPFYPVLGNHDYGGKILVSNDTGGIGNEFDRGPIEVAYTDFSDKWEMPATFYTLTVGNVGFMMLDTNSILWDDTENGDQEAWYAGARASLDGLDWVFGAGHHPYLSNGKHGNAGEYESIEVAGISIPISIPIMDGANVKSFFDTYVCGTIDMYFSGHDHNRQWVEEPGALCGAPMIVSGAGAKFTALSDPSDTSNNTLYQDDTKAGFAYVVVDGKSLTLQFFDSDLNLDFEKTITLP